jgi:hypothetical protein
MGYHTDFEGQFDCYHSENKQIGAFLSAIHDGDLVAVAALADWLSENGDARGDPIAGMVVSNTLDLSKFWQLFGLKTEHAAYLKQFSETRRMRRDPKYLKRFPDPVRETACLPLGVEGGYFVAGGRCWGQDSEAPFLDYNRPPEKQPGLWCQWVPNEHGTAIIWNGGETFFDYVQWLEYLLEHFLTPWRYVVNGKVNWAGEHERDRGTIVVKDNKVTTLQE